MRPLTDWAFEVPHGHSGKDIQLGLRSKSPMSGRDRCDQGPAGHCAFCRGGVLTGRSASLSGRSSRPRHTLPLPQIHLLGPPTRGATDRVPQTTNVFTHSSGDQHLRSGCPQGGFLRRCLLGVWMVPSLCLPVASSLCLPMASSLCLCPHSLFSQEHPVRLGEGPSHGHLLTL